MQKRTSHRVSKKLVYGTMLMSLLFHLAIIQRCMCRQQTGGWAESKVVCHWCHRLLSSHITPGWCHVSPKLTRWLYCRSRSQSFSSLPLYPSLPGSDDVSMSKTANPRIVTDGLALLRLMLKRITCWIVDFIFFPIIRKMRFSSFLAYFAPHRW